ncbi:MAG: guanylate kinase [Candidatus Omnitrophota bacterium]
MSISNHKPGLLQSSGMDMSKIEGPVTRNLKKNRNKHGIKVFIVSGPGGAGKTTIIKTLFKKKRIRDRFLKAISYTTRDKRLGERNAIDYFFVDKKKFDDLKKQNFFLESEKVVNNYYGTPKFFYNRAKKEKKNLILCIDVKGGAYLKKTLNPQEISTVFISAPSQKELIGRLTKRVEKNATIKTRIELAKKELKFSKKYDYVLVNHSLKSAAEKLASILFQESFL